MKDSVDKTITVDTHELDQAIHSLPTLAPLLMQGEAQLMNSNSNLYIIIFGASFELPCEGNWSEVVRIPLKLLYGLKGRLPETPRIQLFVRDKWLYFGSLKLSCEVQERARQLEGLSVEAGFLDLLSLSQKLTREEQTEAGLNGAVSEALDKLECTLDKAWPYLSKLGVPKEVFVRAIQDYSLVANSQK